MEKGTSIAFDCFEQWVILVHGDVPPLDSEWKEYVDALVAADAGVLIQYTALTGWLPTF